MAQIFSVLPVCPLLRLSNQILSSDQLKERNFAGSVMSLTLEGGPQGVKKLGTPYACRYHLI